MKLPSTLVITDCYQKQFTFDTFEAFEIFLNSQIEFWSKCHELANLNPYANKFIQKYSGFQAILNQVSNWKPQFETWDSITFNANVSSLVNNQIGVSWLWSEHSFIQKWLELNEISNNIADAFLESVVGKTNSKLGNGSDFFHGYLIAYEYINQDKTDINKRRNSEAKSLNQLRNQLLEKHDELIGRVGKFESDISQWESKTKSEFSEWHNTQKNHLDDVVLAQSKNFHEQLSVWVAKHNELENQFREKLRFDSAATYWGNKVKTFKRQGYWWASGLLILLVAGIGLFSKFFLGWLSGQPTGLGLQSIEGVLIFATILSSFAFLIKALSKMTFSSFHLMRDAEEREQLTHLYLSLREGGGDDAESRRVVLQALFSRSDTGLLAGDHSPTMPTVQDAIKIIK